MHVDVDSFFAQVEQLRNPALQGLPIAVQQHQDIIAANHVAKAAGVRKNMEPQQVGGILLPAACISPSLLLTPLQVRGPPPQARRALAAVGGRVVHVHTEAGGRVSYQVGASTGTPLLPFLWE